MQFSERVKALTSTTWEDLKEKDRDTIRGKAWERLLGKNWRNKEVVSESYRKEVKESVDGLLDWMEDALNGKLVGKESVQPLYYEGNVFHLTIKPIQFSEKVIDKHAKRLKLR